MYDLLILGGSAAGVTAAIYAARRKVNLKIITGDIGGEIATTDVIENFPGYKTVTGFELAQKFKEQLEYQQVPIDFGFFVKKIEQIEGGFKIISKSLTGIERVDEARAVIIATGVHPRHLDVPGEKDFVHKGVTYCATCDAPLFKNKIVAVTGGGNSALESALMLADIAAQVYTLVRKPAFKGETIMIDKVNNHPKIKNIYNAVITKVEGEKFVTGVEYQVGEEKKMLAVQGLFVHVGWLPNSDFIDFVKKNATGEIEVDITGATDVPGVFAAGDVTNVPYKQITIATGMGCAAALKAIEFLNRR